MSTEQGMLFDEVEFEHANGRPLAVASDLIPIEIGPFGTNQVYKLDCIEAMRQIPDGAVDVAIADPPYNLSKGGNWAWDNSVPLAGFGGDWNKVMAEWDDMPLSEYVSFSLSWLREVQRVVKPTGSIWVHGTYHNCGVLNFCMQLLQIEIINEVVWYKRNSFPNLSGRRLTASHESILWAHTGKKREYHFNYDEAKKMGCPEDRLKEAGKQLRTVWDIPNNKKREELLHGKHPTQKPLRLIRRMLEVSAKPGWVVLVPFAGAGSECVAAKQFGAHFVAFEVDDEYVDVCRKRLGQSRTKQELPATSQNRVEGSERRATVPSLIKWTGSKRAQAASIVNLMPEYRRYFEPFVGGGAVLYLANRGMSIAGDVYRPLIEFWKLVRNDPDVLVENYAAQWRRLEKELDSLDGVDVKTRGGLPKYYYKVRRRFNEEKSPLDLNFLMRTCVNGIVRFNDDGAFNNSFHLSRRGMVPETFERAVKTWHKVVASVDFVCQDYEATVSEAKSGDFVYLDPPYAGNRQRYIENLDVERLFGVLERLNSRGVKWALSFDGRRGETDLTHGVPSGLFKRQLYLFNGNSAVHKVLNGPIEEVHESLYLNY